MKPVLTIGICSVIKYPWSVQFVLSSLPWLSETTTNFLMTEQGIWTCIQHQNKILLDLTKLISQISTTFLLTQLQE